MKTDYYLGLDAAKRKVRVALRGSAERFLLERDLPMSVAGRHELLTLLERHLPAGAGLLVLIEATGVLHLHWAAALAKAGQPSQSSTRSWRAGTWRGEILQDKELLRLARLCGLSLVTIYGLSAAIGDIQRFANSKKLVAYLGLNPSVCQSGNYEGATALKRHGRGPLRALLIQSAKKLLQVSNPLQKGGNAQLPKAARLQLTGRSNRPLPLR